VAVETGITVYDALYVAPVYAHDATSVTADRRLYRQLAGSDFAPRIQML
jgi:predicted nucleic acid-binding protein